MTIEEYTNSIAEMPYSTQKTINMEKLNDYITKLRECY